MKNDFFHQNLTSIDHLTWQFLVMHKWTASDGNFVVGGIHGILALLSLCMFDQDLHCRGSGNVDMTDGFVLNWEMSA